MKNYRKYISVLLVTLCSLCVVQAQNTRADKKAEKLAAVKNLINTQRYVFVANYAIPLGGGGRSLTSSYDVTITKDTVTAYLPYFGRAYAVEYGSIDNGIKFTTTHFTYKINAQKNGWDILINITDSRISDPKGVRQLRLNIGADGYASLQVSNQNRDPITFTGYIEAIGKK